MKLARLALPFAVLFMAGCASHAYYYAPAPPPPPAYAGPSPLVERAQQEGFRVGMDDGAHDMYDGSGYHPKHDRGFRDTPGYDPALGPFNVYRDTFRNAYMRGYDKSFYRR
jgi:hypothetical protein